MKKPRVFFIVFNLLCVWGTGCGFSTQVESRNNRSIHELAAGSTQVVFQKSAVVSGDSLTASSEELAQEEQEMVHLINEYRQNNGLMALQPHQVLRNSAQWHARDMGENKLFAHTDSLGRTTAQRLTVFGVPVGEVAWGENLAAGAADASSTIEAWKKSTGHNKAMLNSKYRLIGVARVYVEGSPHKYYWVTDFMSEMDQSQN